MQLTGSPGPASRGAQCICRAVVRTAALQEGGKFDLGSDTAGRGWGGQCEQRLKGNRPNSPGLPLQN